MQELKVENGKLLKVTREEEIVISQILAEECVEVLNVLKFCDQSIFTIAKADCTNEVYDTQGTMLISYTQEENLKIVFGQEKVFLTVVDELDFEVRSVSISI